ncbi:SusC/RagA family TonB-linked outer membrane protein [Persicobacter diffluens]|uniref:SusC/RagA family TonB-linked outer membrane protein n=1 Tax=Persicobacter diffluens TaxID=981 RepID=A0AAN4W3K9_9BACT|nr:SusC/RagA family TonB-linked outer membrane protein [Persicobacter diffluens]
MKHIYQFFIGCLLFCLSIPAMAQEVAVKGQVTDTDGQPLIGATVQLKGSTIGTIVGMTGEYSLSLPQKADNILVFSFVGYDAQEIKVGNQSKINVQLTTNVTELSEVVVTALGVKRESKSLVYAQQGVSAEEMKEARSTNFISTLAGKAAGVQITGSQTPNGSTNVVIRGVASLTGSNAPLYIVNGIPIENESQNQSTGMWQEEGNEQVDLGDPLSQINPDDIEDIQVLKGANASALYGSRAANGVIIITTKKGETKNGLGVTVNSNFMWQQVNQWPDYQYVYGAGINNVLIRGTQDIDKETGLPIPGNSQWGYGSPMLGFEVIDLNGEQGRYLPQTNNVRDLYQTGLTASNSVSIEGATDKATIRLSYTNTSSEWMMKGQEELSRHNLSLRGTMKLTKKLSVDASLMYALAEVRNRVYPNGSLMNPAFSYIHMMPNMGKSNLNPYKDENGNLFRPNGNPWFSNPYWDLNENKNGDISNRILSNVLLRYKLIDGLQLTAKASGDVFLRKGFKFIQYGAAYDPDGRYSHFSNDIYNWNFEGLAVYNKRIDNKFSINATAGANSFIYDNKSAGTDIDQLLMPGLPSVENNAGIARSYQGSGESIINSVFGSASFGYKGTLFVDGTIRNDWSSTLPSKNNSFFYPSVGTSFIFSELLGTQRILNYGKLRASWAEVGNGTRPFRVHNFHTYGGIYNGLPWTSNTASRQNPNLLPETTRSVEFGLETKLFNIINLNVTYYNSESIDQIVDMDLPSSTGYARGTFNSGSLTNKGWEVFLGVDWIKRKNFKWTSDINWSNNRTYVNTLGTLDRQQLGTVFETRVFAEPGMPFGVIRGNKPLQDPVTGTNLINAETGFYVQNTDQILGNVQKDWIGGVNNRFEYKGFTLSFLVDVAWGGEIFSQTFQRQGQYGVAAWTLEGRDDQLFSQRILGENLDERRGKGLYGNDYIDTRDKGALLEGTLYEFVDATGDGQGVWVATGKPNDRYLTSQQWAQQTRFNGSRATFDGSYIKLREISIGYNLPTKIIGPFKRIRVSAVGRNVAILYQNTPKGIDPELGSNIGLEYASMLPSASYGFNINMAF